MPGPVRPLRAALAVVALASFALALVFWWARQGIARDLPEPPGARVDCVSYAPYRLPGESPFLETTRVSEERIEADLRILAERTACVRTYSTQQGLDQVPKVAERLGMQVLVGAWLGRERSGNDIEIARAVELAHEHPRTVRALIVGNEVLLRRELPERALIEYLKRTRAAAGSVPVTYADVWEIWLEHPGIADAVSFVTIHILPYWEDEPVAIDQAIAHVLQVARRMKDLASGKEILIGETGWPSAGRARREAVPGRIEQARFLRQFVHAAREQGLRYNLIEAFDQPWKRRLEGAMGGYWGLFDSQGIEKFPWSGPVEADPSWRRGLLAGAGGALLAALLAAALAARVAWVSGVSGAAAGGTSVARAVTMGDGAGRWAGIGRRIIVHALAGFCAGAMMMIQWDYLVRWNRDLFEWAITLLFTAMAIALWFVSVELFRRPPAATDASAAAVLADLRRSGLVGVFVLLRALMLLGAAGFMLLLAFDPRYRGFPWPLYALPTMGLLLVRLARPAPRRGGRPGESDPGAIASPGESTAYEENLCASLIALASAAVLVIERPSNQQALAFVALMLLMAGLASGFRYGFAPGAGKGGRANTSALASTPTADGSTQ
jgi:exo-beta-1,3-glucanase (GH17 family)